LNDPELRQREVDEEDLDQQRRAPHEGHVERRDPVEDRVPRQPAQGTNERQSGGERDRGERDDDRDSGAADDVRSGRRDEVGVDVPGRVQHCQQRADQGEPGEPEPEPERQFATAVRRLDLLEDWRRG
jgi:hypothetical protein